MAYQILQIALLIFGFGFVIFWHELGHFLAARWAGVRVEQFAVGMGQAIFSYRRGLGLKLGSSRKEYEDRTAEWFKTTAVAPKGPDGEYTEYQREQASKALGLGETEYRLSWIPLGGYVKPTGQDDLRPNAQVLEEDPHSYNAAPIGKRMVIISAGVIMNIILAAMLFMALFLIGYNVPPAVVGGVQPDSPAQRAGLMAGDRILYYDNTFQHDFNKIRLNVALSRDNVPVDMLVERIDGKQEQLRIVPARADDDPHSFVALGVVAPFAPRGPKEADYLDEAAQSPELVDPESLLIRPGDEILKINGKPLLMDTEAQRRQAIATVDGEVQRSSGKPVVLSVRNQSGQSREVAMQPHLLPAFKDTEYSFAGMLPRVQIDSLQENSSARGKLRPGDIVLRVINADAHVDQPAASRTFLNLISSASQRSEKIDLVVLRGTEEVTIKGLATDVKLESRQRGLGVAPGIDELHAVAAEITPDSPAGRAKIPAGATIVSVDGQPVSTWLDVAEALRNASADRAIAVVARTDQAEQSYPMTLTASELATFQQARYVLTAGRYAAFGELIEPRKTANPLVAARWGVVETRDFILQFYLTLQRMFSGDVSYKNMMGPVGIVYAGSKFAFKGTDWLIWFLAMISANLAVVNFLPIPIVDGGQFVFLIIEKIMGKPLSPKAQAVAQYVGLALLLSVFLLVTYQDIARFF